jgi:predicted GNAT family N-acyltransferase
MTDILIRVAATPEDRTACFAVRVAVFVDEQGVSPEVELDEHDAQGAATTHLLALADGRPIGAMRWRAVPPGKAKIERVAVLAEARRHGVGRLLMAVALRQIAAAGIGAAVLYAQTSARDFYECLGFVPEGEAFVEEGIEHVRMRLEPVRAKD